MPVSGADGNYYSSPTVGTAVAGDNYETPVRVRDQRTAVAGDNYETPVRFRDQYDYAFPSQLQPDDATNPAPLSYGGAYCIPLPNACRPLSGTESSSCVKDVVRGSVGPLLAPI